MSRLRNFGTVTAAVLVALVATSVTWSASTRTQAVRGIGMIRLGDSAKIGSAHLPQSAYVILSPYNGYLAKSIRAANPQTTVLAYKSSMDVQSNAFCAANPAGCATGITYAEATAHDKAFPSDPWILRDAGMRPVQGAYPENYLGDVGSASYQQHWLANVSSYLHTNGLSGVFIDNVLGDVSGWSRGRFPAKYPTDSAWENAMASFVDHIGKALQQQGFFVAVNAYKPYPDDAAWWRRIAPATDALTNEYWQQNPNDVHDLYTADAPSWKGQWEYWVRLIDVAQNAGSSFFGIQYGDASDSGLSLYGRASFLLAWNGRSGAYFFNPTNPADPWQAGWTNDIGTPAGSRTRVGAGWRRDFSHGIVLVDPSATKTQTFTFSHPYLLPDGTQVSQLTLGPTSAAILTSPVGAPAPTPKPRPARRHGILWDGKWFTTRRAFGVWLRSHHVTWAAWARRHAAAAKLLA
jgi:Hypothetical glycosyl hydrolase family 15